MEPDKLARGTSVVLVGLEAADLNGRQGTVKGTVKGSKGATRYRVRLTQGADGINQKFSIQPKNLRVVKPMPKCLLSSLVMPREAKVFEEVAKMLGGQGLALMSEDVVTRIQGALREVMQDDSVTVCVKGSMFKGTQVHGSDVDVVISTPGRSMSMSDKQEVAEKLKKHRSFHQSHVKLKRWAISCVFEMVREVDLVFEDTVEYGKLPGTIESKFEGNVAAQNAARMLKTAVKLSVVQAKCDSGEGGIHLPAFVLELLVLDAWDTLGTQAQAVHADGAMQLFVNAIQLLVDSGPAQLTDQKLHSPSWLAKFDPEGLLLRHLAPLLHLFCASRVYSPTQEGFVDECDMERWVRQICPRPNLETPLGQVPSWIVGYYNFEKDCLFGFLTQCDGQPKRRQHYRSLEECQNAVRTVRAAQNFMESQFARYTARRLQNATDADAKCTNSSKKTNGTSNDEEMMRSLQHLAAQGSAVARQMFDCRIAWFEGEMALDNHDYVTAVSHYARSIRMSCDGDPFSGVFRRASADYNGFALYHRAVEFVLSKCAEGDERTLDARVLRSILYLTEQKFQLSIDELTKCIQRAPNDAKLYDLRATVHGNLANWTEVLRDCNLCIKCKPSDPISYFWRGVALMALMNLTTGTPDGKDAAAMASFRNFVGMASPEGRKVCEAWWRMSQLAALLHQDKTAMLELAKEGFAAEEKMLAPLKKLELSSDFSGAKQIALLVVKMSSAFSAAPEASGDASRRHDKNREQELEALVAEAVQSKIDELDQLVKAKAYETAIRKSSKLLEEQPPGCKRHVVLGKRCAALLKVEEYTGAERDAAEWIKLDSKSVKAHLLLAKAKLGKCEADAALLAAEAGLTLKPGTKVQKKLLEVAEQARELMSRGVGRMKAKRSSLQCWDRVLYKDSVLLVDAGGTGDYASLRDAVRAAPEDTPTSIVVLPGSYTFRWPMSQSYFEGSSSRIGVISALQIIGEGEIGEVCVALADTADGLDVMFLAIGPGSSVFVESLEMTALSRHSTDDTVVHCIYCGAGATMHVTNCHLRSTNASMSISDVGSKLFVSRCTTFGPGSGILAAGGECEAYSSKFLNTQHVTIEVREGGICLLDRCEISKSSVQGVVLYRGGVSVTMLGCKVLDCGSFLKTGAVMVSCGKAVIKDCVLENSRGDGLVVQDEDGTAHVDMSGCAIYKSAGNACVMYGGSGVLTDNNVQENCVGIGVHASHGSKLLSRRVSFVRNTISGCFNGPSFMVSGNPGESIKQIRKRVEFDGNTGHCIIHAITDFVTVFAGNIEEIAQERRKHTRCELVCGSTGRVINSEEGATFPSVKDWLAVKASGIKNQFVTSDASACHFLKQPLIDMQERQVEVQNKMPIKMPIQCSDFGLLGPADATKTKTECLRECRITDLSSLIGRRAEGLILFGTLCTRPLRMRAVQTVLADNHGDAVRIALYNMLGCDKAHWRDCFPKGMQVGIREPFLKRAADGAPIVRVDDKDDVIFVTQVCTWRECRRAENKAEIEGGGATEAGVRCELKRCSKCATARYCSRECQKKDWKYGGHKETCCK